MPQTNKNPHIAMASSVLGLGAIALTWSAINSLNNLATLIPFSVGATGLHYAGVGIRRKYSLTLEDHKAIAPELWSCLSAGYAEAKESMMPIVEDIQSIPGIERVSTPKLDLMPILTHSSAIVAPTGTGKSFFLSLVMTERQRQFPSAPFKICSIDTWKRNHTWMGLSKCPKWLQRTYIALGYKYQAEGLTVTEAIHRETIDAVARLHDLMESRAKEIRDNQGESGVDLTYNTVIIDEFPQFFEFITETKATVEDQHGKKRSVANLIKDLLVRGHGYHCLLYVVSQDDAVNMMGLKEAQKRQLFICSLFKDDVDTNDSRHPIINSVKGRRVLFEHGGKAAIAPIPSLAEEPKLNWEVAIEKGRFRGWVDELLPEIKRWHQDGATVTDVWTELTKRVDFPAKLKRQGRDNPDYVYFTDSIWSNL